MRKFSTRECDYVWQDILQTINGGDNAHIHNPHETFYGWDFQRWLENGIKANGIPCTLEVIGHDPLEGFPSEFILHANDRNRARWESSLGYYSFTTPEGKEAIKLYKERDVWTARDFWHLLSAEGVSMWMWDEEEYNFAKGLCKEMGLKVIE